MRWLWIAAVTLLLALGGAVVATNSGCDEDCLAPEENCSAAYKQANYGTTDIWCCGGMTCQKTINNNQVCR